MRIISTIALVVVLSVILEAVCLFGQEASKPEPLNRTLWHVVRRGKSRFHLQQITPGNVITPILTVKSSRPSCGPMYQLDDGNFFFTQTGKFLIVDKTGKVVLRYTCPDQRKIGWCRPLANGNIIVAESSSQKTVKSEKGKDKTVLTSKPRIIEVTRDEKIVNTVELEFKGKHESSRYQIADVEIYGNHFIVCHTNDKIVNEYAHDGKLIKTLFSYKRKGRGGPISVELCPNGNFLITTSEGHNAGIFEVTPDGKIVWQVLPEDIPEAQLQKPVNAWKAENGNVFVSNAAGHNGKWNGWAILEISPDKKVVRALCDYLLPNQTLWVCPVTAEKNKK